MNGAARVKRARSDVYNASGVERVRAGCANRAAVAGRKFSAALLREHGKTWARCGRMQQAWRGKASAGQRHLRSVSDAASGCGGRVRRANRAPWRGASGPCHRHGVLLATNGAAAASADRLHASRPTAWGPLLVASRGRASASKSAAWQKALQLPTTSSAQVPEPAVRTRVARRQRLGRTRWTWGLPALAERCGAEAGVRQFAGHHTSAQPPWRCRRAPARQRVAATAS